MRDLDLVLRDLAQHLEAKRHSLFGIRSLNVGRVEGCTIPDMVRNRCRIEGDRRVLLTEMREEALA